MKILFTVLLLSFLLINSNCQVENLISEGQFFPLYFNEKNITQKKIIKTTPIDFSETLTMMISGQTLKQNTIALMVYAINNDGEGEGIKKYLVFPEGTDEIFFRSSGSASENLIIEQSHKIYDGDIQKLCPQKDCTLYFELSLKNISGIDNRTEYPDGTIQYTFQRKQLNKNMKRQDETHAGPISLLNADNIQLSSNSQAYAWTYTDVTKDFSPIQVFHFIAHNKVQNSKLIMNLFDEHYGEDLGDKFAIKIKETEEILYDPLQSLAANFTWPELEDDEYKNFKIIDPNNRYQQHVTNKVFPKCEKKLCSYAISVYIKKWPGPGTHLKSSFYIQLPWISADNSSFQLVNLEKEIAYNEVFIGEYEKNQVTQNLHLNIADNKYDTLVVRAFSTNTEIRQLLPIHYEVFSYTKDASDIKLIGTYMNDQFALINPSTGQNYYVIFYGNGKQQLSFNCTIEKKSFQSVETAAQKQVKMVFINRQVHSIYEEYTVTDDRIESIDIQLKNLPDKEVYQYMKFQVRHCENNNECTYPTDDNKEWSIELGKQTGMVYKNQEKNCKKGCIILMRTYIPDNFPSEQPQFQIDLGISANGVPAPDDDGGLSTWIIIVIVLSCVFVVSLAGFIGLRYYRKKKQQADNYAKMEYNNDVEEGEEEEA